MKITTISKFKTKCKTYNTFNIFFTFFLFSIASEYVYSGKNVRKFKDSEQGYFSEC